MWKCENVKNGKVEIAILDANPPKAGPKNRAQNEEKRPQVSSKKRAQNRKKNRKVDAKK